MGGPQTWAIKTQKVEEDPPPPAQNRIYECGRHLRECAPPQLSWRQYRHQTPQTGRHLPLRLEGDECTQERAYSRE